MRGSSFGKGGTTGAPVIGTPGTNTSYPSAPNMPSTVNPAALPNGK